MIKHKKALIISTIAIAVIIAVFFYYPVSDSEGLSYAIIFICFAALCFSGAKIITANEPTDYDSTENQMDKLYAEDGIFTYTEEGFYFTKDSEAKQYIKYADIVEVNEFTIPFLHEQTHSGIELITSGKKYEFIDRYCKGFLKFSLMLSKNLAYHESAEMHRVNNHGLKKRNLLQKKL